MRPLVHKRSLRNVDPLINLLSTLFMNGPKTYGPTTRTVALTMNGMTRSAILTLT